MRESVSVNLRQDVLRRDRHTCRYCGNKTGPFHLDHVYPVVRGGETSFNNLVTACGHCNAMKHASIGIWPKPVGYFDEKEYPEISISGVIYLLLGTGFMGNMLMASIQDSFSGLDLVGGFLGLVFLSGAILKFAGAK